MNTRIEDIRNKLIVFAVVTGIFLPIRLIFYTYVSMHWIGSLGLVSSILMAITFLAHKNKLGCFGNIFITQMTKTMKGKSGVLAIGLSLLMIAYLGSTLVWIERGNTTYLDEKQIVSQIIWSNSNPNPSQVKDMDKILQAQSSDVFGFSRFDQIISMTYAIMNDMMGGWLVNLDTILLIEQFEVLGMILFYRKVCTRYFSVIPRTPQLR
ncbi:MAG: hypothetical protein KGI27_04335 [Thaumarchaeota archaeon]|nr:hypothetical protein [Nitrososphaerota archaeon]